MTTWLPGMRTKNRIRIVSVHPDGYIEGYYEDGGYIMQVGSDAEPDTDDTATMACMMMGEASR